MSSLTALARDDHSARTLLALLSAPNDKVTGQLLANFGAVEVVRLIESDVNVPGMNKVEAAIWRERTRPAMSIDRLVERIRACEQYEMIVPGDTSWPTAFNDLGHQAPYVIWAKGDLSQLAATPHSLVAITGARASTSYGQQVAEDIAGGLAHDKYVCVAGGAYGIEAVAHRSALAAGGNTIAVLASGIDRAYPAGHADLFERIEQRGLIMSEVPPGLGPTRQRFLDRARLIAALSGTTVVVEAGARSGSLEVARQAQNLGRAVGAVPGPITSAASCGSNLLIRTGSAKLVTSTEDVNQLVSMKNEMSGTPVFRDLAPRAAAHTLISPRTI